MEIIFQCVLGLGILDKHQHMSAYCLSDCPVTVQNLFSENNYVYEFYIKID